MTVAAEDVSKLMNSKDAHEKDRERSYQESSRSCCSEERMLTRQTSKQTRRFAEEMPKVQRVQ